MIHGAHVIIYSKDAEADRAFFRDVLKYESVDAGHGWLIFALPPSEVAVHPSDENNVHELFLMCDDVQAFVAEMSSKGVACTPIQTPPWGALTQVVLPGGGKLGVYQPRHARPKPMRVRAKRTVKAAKRGKPAEKRAAARPTRRKGSARPGARKSAPKRGRRR